ncbi:energy-coupled thiamine transporter ThiT [Irregularibacter muris]|uniref:Energy-coupled thiamine transporter ThiT n=1 Tax=Irregularibacter muris TaxID=1796619 RepID=A0AAE3HJ75_9FIRM|nr:energy-coupled thiamine transporter ThiT [Irregularibacter muris]MCR1899854.1 energy-coupled thiamine transporter ThiT [Irregularibacter muris]
MFEKFLEFKPLTIIILASLVLISIALAFRDKKYEKRSDYTRMIVYGSLCIALSFVLSYIRLYRFPQGGSITPASMLPMYIFAIMFGPTYGIIAGFAFGMINLIQDPYIIHWAQFFLDYPLSYGALGLAGLYRKNIGVSCLIGGFGRFFMNFLSGVIFFGSYAPPGMNVMLYSLVVNGLVIGTDTLVCILISFIPQIKNAIQQVQKISAS